MEIILVLVAVGGFFWVQSYVLSEPPLSQKCMWERCGQIGGEIINCEPIEHGTLAELVEVIKGTNAGAVRWKCGDNE